MAAGSPVENPYKKLPGKFHFALANKMFHDGFSGEIFHPSLIELHVLFEKK